MSAIPLIVALVLSAGAAIGFIAVVVGIKRQDKAMSLGAASPELTAGLARHVTGLHVRDGDPSSRIAETASIRPGRGVPTAPARRCVAR
jgi:hypothetical protein